jgi:hypothetical protein
MSKPLKTYFVNLVVQVPARATIEVQARSQSEAELKTIRDIEKKKWLSNAWMEAEWDVQWGEANDLEVVEET